MLVYNFCSIGQEGHIFHKIGSASGVNYLKIRGTRGYHSRKHPLRHGQYWQKMQAAFCLCSLTPPELIA